MNELKPSRIADTQQPRLRSIDGLAAPAVEASQLRKTYPGGVEAVKGIDFDVAPGEVFGCSARTAPASRRRSEC